MEFHEKLQLLRKKHHLTQEELAEKLYVSRTAVSKWESGRGYPNLESLKCISKLYGVSIDELLSSDELIELAETENHAAIHRICSLTYGILDCMLLICLFMPFFGLQEGDYVRAVTLLAYTGVSSRLRVLYLASLGAVSLCGVLEIVMGLRTDEKRMRRYGTCSMALHAGAILLFAISRQAYVTAFLFLLFVAKGVLIQKQGKM